MERFGPTRRGGPVFRWLGEPLAIDLANTVMVVRDGEEVDLLAADLERWLDAERERLAGTPERERLLALRDAVREVLAAAADGGPLPASALARVNAASAAAPVAPQLTADGSREELAPADPLAAIARSAIDVVARERVRICGAPSCGMFFLGARRWCCAACGNRARAARHYARTRL